MSKRVLSKVLNVIGVLLIITVIVGMIPLTIPKWLGYRTYGVETASMTPAYSVGGVIYVRECKPTEITEGDVVTFRLGSGTDKVMTHRVIEIMEDEQAFVTKGDANNTADPEPVAFDRLIGKVAFSIPGMARLSDFLKSVTGKAVIFMMFAGAVIFWILADLCAPSKSKREKTAAGPTETAAKKKPNLTVLAGVGLLVVAGICIGVVAIQYGGNAKEYHALAKQVFADERNLTASDTEGMDDTQVQEQMDEAVRQAVAKLQQENSETIGWIVFDNLDISYPIMQAADNNKYLHTSYSGKQNSAGSIFLEAANHRDLEDYHTIIYGHNMRNGSMFGKLKQYKTQDVYENNRYFTIYTADKTYRYEVFAYYDIAQDGDIYAVGFGPDHEYKQFLDKMKKRSYYNTGVEVSETDKVVTLSTCSTKGNRFVVHAKRMEQ